VKSDKVSDAYLFLHVAPTGDVGYDCSQLAAYYGVENRLLLSEPEVWNGITEDRLAHLYSCFDIQLSTTQGEGFGLTTLEGMACGVPQIAPKWSALGDWAMGSSALVPCSSTAATTDNINAIGGIMDREEAVSTLRSLYRSPGLRDEYSRMGMSLAYDTQYRWEHIGQRFLEELQFAANQPVAVLIQQKAAV
jgi:D-inositol-3-phosphate glycosyltransferase